jgi:hypothetical protein
MQHLDMCMTWKLAHDHVLHREVMCETYARKAICDSEKTHTVIQFDLELANPPPPHPSISITTANNRFPSGHHESHKVYL